MRMYKTCEDNPRHKFWKVSWAVTFHSIYDIALTFSDPSPPLPFLPFLSPSSSPFPSPPSPFFFSLSLLPSPSSLFLPSPSSLSLFLSFSLSSLPGCPYTPPLKFDITGVDPEVGMSLFCPVIFPPVNPALRFSLAQCWH